MDAFLEDGSHEATVAVVRALAVAVPHTTDRLRDYILNEICSCLSFVFVFYFGFFGFYFFSFCCGIYALFLAFQCVTGFMLSRSSV